MTSNGSLGSRSNSLKNGSVRHSLISVLVSLDPCVRADIAPMKLVFWITLLSSSLEHSFDPVVLDFCRDFRAISYESSVVVHESEK